MEVSTIVPANERTCCEEAEWLGEDLTNDLDALNAQQPW